MSALNANSEEGKLDAQRTEARRALERFVVEDDDLLDIESRIGRLNIFDALGITRVEIRHSNFLAFILDPAESHGQGQLFLKAILMDLLKDAPPELRPLSPIDLDGTDLRGVEVKREWKNIDLLITSAEPRFAVVIENKIGSRDHSNQLNRYSTTIRECHPSVKALFVYLTPDGDDPSEDTDVTWLPYTYADIHRVFKRLRETYTNSIGEDMRVFLDHYLNLLGSRFMNDEKLDELCRRIYKNHRQALDLIWERVGSPGSAVLAEVGNLLEADGRWHVFYSSNKFVEIVPETWLKWLAPFGAFGEDPRYWIFAQIKMYEGKLVRLLWVGPMGDAAKRSQIIAILRDKAPGLGFKRSKATQLEGKWNRIAAAETILEWAEDEEPDPAVIRETVKKELDEMHPKFEMLASVLKPLCSVSAPKSGS